MDKTICPSLLRRTKCSLMSHSHTHRHRRTGQFFLGGLSHLCPKNVSTVPEKIWYANLQNYFAQLTPYPVISIVKIPDFGHFVSLGRMDSVFSFNKYKNILFSFLATGLCPKNLAFARKDGFARVWRGFWEGLQPPCSPLVRTPMSTDLRKKISHRPVALFLGTERSPHFGLVTFWSLEGHAQLNYHPAQIGWMAGTVNRPHL